jgi:hypothetical protein
MPTGVEYMQKTQLGLEAATAAGSAVVASAIWRGPAWKITDTRETIYPDENIAILSKYTDRTYIPFVGAEIEQPETEATFEQLGYILGAGVKGAVEAVADSASAGSPTGKIYTYSFSTTAQVNPDTRTIEAGDDNQAYEAEYAFVRSFQISGAPKEALKVKSSWIGRQSSKCSFTNSISLPTVEEIMFTKGLLYINDSGGTIGGTIVSSTLYGFELDVEDTGFIPKWAPNGQLYFDSHKQKAVEALLRVTFEHNASATAEIDKWKAGSGRLVRLIFTGSALTTAGAYTNKTLIIDAYGLWQSFGPLNPVDGNNTVEGVLRFGYSSTDTPTSGRIIVVNELATLP